jgi:putative endonuclease
VPPIDRFLDASHTRGRGLAAERDGIAWLRRQGLTVLEHNVHFRAGELDVVALEDDTLCFIEIKARASDRFGSAVEAITPHKQRQIAAAAKLYLATHPWDGPCRFDVLAMDAEAGGWRYTYLRDAFELA